MQSVIISFLNVVASVCVFLLHSALSETYTVGDEDQWRTGVNYLSWSAKYTFRVDDILVFQYTKGTHNVFQVTEDTFRSCNSSNGVVASYQSGHDRIQLTEPNKFWFICDVEDHCRGGMRFGINVLSAGNNTSGSSHGGTDPSILPNGSSSTSQGGRTPVFIFLVVLLLAHSFH